MKKTFVDLLKAQKKLVGMFVESTAPEMVEIIGGTGFDFVTLDLEHGPFDAYKALEMIRAADAFDIPAMARISVLENAYIKTLLDMGAAGIIVPNIDSRAQAEEAVRLAKFMPEGRRGVNPGVRANRYGEGGSDFYARANRETSVVLMIESGEGIEHFDEIVSVKGVDGILVGPLDLSVALGFNGNSNHPEVKAAVSGLIRKANAAGMPIGVFAMDPQRAKELYDEGANYVAYGVDTMVFYQACQDILTKLGRK